MNSAPSAKFAKRRVKWVFKKGRSFKSEVSRIRIRLWLGQVFACEA